MIVTVDHNYQKEQEIAIAQKIVVDAVKFGEKGKSKFIHDKEVLIDYAKVIRLVIFYTEGSVTCTERGHSDDSVIFKINGCRTHEYTSLKDGVCEEYGCILEEDFLDGYYDFEFCKYNGGLDVTYNLRWRTNND